MNDVTYYRISGTILKTSYCIFDLMKKRNVIFKVLSGIVITILLIIIVINAIVEPWLIKKIETAVHEKSDSYQIDIKGLDILIFQRGVSLKNITVQSVTATDSVPVFLGNISSIEVKGIKLMGALLRKEIEIRELVVSNSDLNGELAFPKQQGAKIVSPVSVRISKIVVDELDVTIANAASAQSFLMKEGYLKANNFHVEKMDTLTPEAIGQFDFNTKEFTMVSPDSLNTFSAMDVSYLASTNDLSVSSFSLLPNYTNYQFTGLFPYRKARVNVEINELVFHDFPVANFLKSGNIISSSVEIGKMELQLFIDKRKGFSPEPKAVFLQRLYDFPGIVHIDSIVVLDGSVVYLEHAELADEPAVIWFDALNAHVYNMTNDTIFKTEEGYFDFKADALFMSKAKMNIALTGRLFDREHSFNMNGNLSSIAIAEVNAIVEKNLFINAESGTIDAMNFSLAANDTKATGKMILLYHDLKIAVVNKQTNESKALKEKVVSGIANIIVMDANPKKGKTVREAVIEHDREPEKPFFNYCALSLLSGIKPSLIK